MVRGLLHRLDTRSLWGQVPPGSWGAGSAARHAALRQLTAVLAGQGVPVRS